MQPTTKALTKIRALLGDQEHDLDPVVYDKDHEESHLKDTVSIQVSDAL